MARRKRWEEYDITNGYGEVKLFKWQYFSDFVQQEMLDYSSYIWRGHRNDDWLLESTLDRLVKTAKVSKTKRSDFRTKHLEQFKFASRGRRGIHPPLLENENDWWALGQHYGLAAPLLDWSLSPFVAAYFAFINNGEKQTKNRAIFALHKPSVEDRVIELLIKKFEKEKQEKALIPEGDRRAGIVGYTKDNPSLDLEIEFIRPMSDENQRLVNQNGLFTRAPDDIDLKTWVEKNYPSENKNYILMKILIPNSDREICLKTLNRMNINHLTLSPDLFGASKYCNLFGEVKNY